MREIPNATNELAGMPLTRTPLSTVDTVGLMARGLRVCNMLRDWPEPVLARIAAGSRLQRYARGAQVLAHDPAQRDVLVVVSGAVECSGVNAAGDRFVLGRFAAGDLVGLVRLLPGKTTAYTYHALQDTLLVHVPADHLRALLDAHPLLWREVAMLALARQHDSIVTLQRRGFRRTDQSLAQALLRLLVHGPTESRGSSVRLRVSQGDLAAMVSVSRQTINKELRQLTEMGIVSVTYGELEIRDLAALNRLAETGDLPAGAVPRK